MSIKQEENDVYIIPPNFIETGSLFGGTIKLIVNRVRQIIEKEYSEPLTMEYLAEKVYMSPNY